MHKLIDYYMWDYKGCICDELFDKVFELRERKVPFFVYNVAYDDNCGVVIVTERMSLYEAEELFASAIDADCAELDNEL